IDRNRFSKKIRRFVVQAGLFRGCAIIEIKSRICNLGAFGLGFMQSFFECGDRRLEMFRFALSDAEVVNDFRRLGEVLPRFAEYFDRAVALLQRAKKQLGYMEIWAGVTWFNGQSLY